MYHSSRHSRRGARIGDYKAYCDRTGFRVYASECKMQWDGLFVRKESWEIRQPQQVIKSKFDNLTLPIARPGTAQKQSVDVPPINIF